MKSPKLIIQKATAFQLNAKHSYIIHAPGITDYEATQLKAWLDEHGIKDAVIITTETLNISELPEKPNVAK